MRLRLNLPSELQRFAVSKYVDSWLNEGHGRSDERPRKKARFSGITLLIEKTYFYIAT